MFKNIVVALSGGVDSTVAALLLKNRGFNVTGAFLRNWSTADETGRCLADEDYKDAEWVAKRLKIPLIEINFEKDYWNDVFSYFLESYQNGYTPNPDIMCNKNIKFDKFYNYAINHLKADAIATGHYAKTSFGPFLEGFQPNTKTKLLKATDLGKDQTFFLSQIDQNSLQRCMFPLANLWKRDVRKLAADAGFEVIANKDESTGICFIGSRDFKDFISEYIEDKPGKFVDYETGKIVGEHQGIHHWTLGQRSKICGAATKYFVCKKDAENNIIYVVPGTNHPALYSQSMVTSKPHWIYQEPLELVNSTGILSCDFRFQRNGKLSSCQVLKAPSEKLIITIDQAKRALTPGQFAVFYSGDECLGSASISHIGPSLHSYQRTVSDSNGHQNKDDLVEQNIAQ